MPATFIVLMSFISLVLDRNACAARVSLGVTTVLTITTLMHSAKSNLPHTSYPKVSYKVIFVFYIASKMWMAVYPNSKL